MDWLTSNLVLRGSNSPPTYTRPSPSPSPDFTFASSSLDICFLTLAATLVVVVVFDPPSPSASALSPLRSLACRSRFREFCNEASGRDLAQGSRPCCGCRCLKHPLVSADHHFFVDLLSTQRSLVPIVLVKKSERANNLVGCWQSVPQSDCRKAPLFTSFKSARSRITFRCQIDAGSAPVFRLSKSSGCSRMKNGFDVADCSHIACSVKLIKMFASFTLCKARGVNHGKPLGHLLDLNGRGPGNPEDLEREEDVEHGKDAAIAQYIPLCNFVNSLCLFTLLENVVLRLVPQDVDFFNKYIQTNPSTPCADSCQRRCRFFSQRRDTRL